MEDMNTQNTDQLAQKLRTYGQNILIVIFGLLPLIFLPTTVAPFVYTKVAVVIVGLIIALVLYSLSVLRMGSLSIGVSWPLVALWGVAGIAVISALLSGDIQDALVGDLFSIHSAFFVIILAFVPLVWTFVQASKLSVIRMYLLLAFSTLVLVAFHLLRIVFGENFLSFGVFTDTVSTPVGTWNDLALFLGLTVILSIVALEQLTLSKAGRTLFSVVSIGALFLLGVINFFSVWLVLGLSSLVVIVYTLGKDKFSGGQPSLTGVQSTNSTSLLISLIVFGISVLFIIGGATLGGWIAERTGVSYVEVRPSFIATSNIARDVYAENALLGIGPNKFADAWRLYKDPAINSTVFWNTDFNAGSGYITSFFVTTGVLGGIAWIVFLGLYIVQGVRRLLNASSGDKLWYFIGVSSFVSAVYIWGMSFVYVTGVTVLLLGALCTGVSLQAFRVLKGGPSKSIVVGTNRRAGFVLTLGVIVVIVSSVSVLYATGRHYSSVYSFNESVRAMQQGKTISELEQDVISAHALTSSDVFMRRLAEYQLARINGLAGVQNLNEAQTQELREAAANGIEFAEEAIRIDSQEPANWSVLAGIYNSLIGFGVEGASERALEALGKSRELNPKNPLPFLETAVVEARAGNSNEARTYINQAIALKPNFTEAFFILTQLEIADGNVEAAIQSTRAVISLEPRNAVRYYQLGVLLSAVNDIDGAITSFERAVALDPDYANARYLLALAYEGQGRTPEAITQLERVYELNQDNEELKNLLNTLKQGGNISGSDNVVSTVGEQLPETDIQGNVRTSQDPDSDLLTPVNTLPNTSEGNINEEVPIFEPEIESENPVTTE